MIRSRLIGSWSRFLFDYALSPIICGQPPEPQSGMLFLHF
jgi:hypothetical protein